MNEQQIRDKIIEDLSDIFSRRKSDASPINIANSVYEYLKAHWLLSQQGGELTFADYEEVSEDHRRIAREMDIALNGVDGAAKQASLIDILAQLQSSQQGEGKGMEWVRANERLPKGFFRNKDSVVRICGGSFKIDGRPASAHFISWNDVIQVHYSILDGKAEGNIPEDQFDRVLWLNDNQSPSNPPEMKTNTCAPPNNNIIINPPEVKENETEPTKPMEDIVGVHLDTKATAEEILLYHDDKSKDGIRISVGYMAALAAMKEYASQSSSSLRDALEDLVDRYWVLTYFDFVRRGAKEKEAKQKADCDELYIQAKALLTTANNKDAASNKL